MSHKYTVVVLARLVEEAAKRDKYVGDMEIRIASTREYGNVLTIHPALVTDRIVVTVENNKHFSIRSDFQDTELKANSYQGAIEVIKSMCYTLMVSK